MTHGNQVHKAIENDLKGVAPLPEKYADLASMINKIKSKPGNRLIEHKFGVTQGYKSTTFFAKDVWFRGVIDFGLVGEKTATLLDWKTGKPKPNADQLKLFAAAGFAAFPYVQTIKTGYVWLGHKSIDAATFQRDDLPGIWQEFTPRVIRLVKAKEDDKFPPNPSGLCRNWCPVPNSMCEFSGKC